MKHFLLGIIIFSVACVTSQDRIQNIQYFRDKKTGLCFAAKNMALNNAVMTNVPCTPEVERLIEGDVQ